MALNAYRCASLIGGGAGALDSLDGANLQDLDSAIVFTVDTVYFHVLDDDSGAAESSPDVISPDSNAGNKRWILVFSVNQALLTTSSLTFANLIVSTIATFANTGLHLLDTDASHDLIIKPGSDLTADRTLTITTGDANRTLELAGNSLLPIPGLAVRPKFVCCESLDYTSGGTHELVVGDTVTGETGGATGYIEHITLTSGTWAGGDAAGTIYLTTRNATAFQAETLKDNGNLNCASIGGASSKNAVVIYSFVYHHEGTSEQLVYSDSKIAYEFTSLGASDWSYLYLDDSAIVTAGTNVISATELVDATTEPAWSASKHGQYNGSDRCIFAVRTDGSNNILEFFHENDLVLFAVRINVTNAVDPDTTWTDSTQIIPAFTQKAEVTFYGLYIDGNINLHWRTNGQTTEGGHVILSIGANNRDIRNTMSVITDLSGIIEFKFSGATTDNLAYVDTEGWYFPIGL